MNNKVYSIEEIQQLVKPIAEKYKIDRVYLFGSYARGEAKEKSDIDLLISNFERTKPFTLANILADFSERLDKPVDLVTESSLNTTKHSQLFTKAIFEERRLVYGS